MTRGDTNNEHARAGKKGKVSALEVSIAVAAGPETVFRCFTDSTRLSEWLNARARVDPRPGGELRIDFHHHGVIVVGAVIEIIPTQRIIFSWGVEEGPLREAMPPGSTRVTITLRPNGGATLVTLRHEGFPSENERRDHEEGWKEYLSRLAGTVAADRRNDGGPTSRVP